MNKLQNDENKNNFFQQKKRRLLTRPRLMKKYSDMFQRKEKRKEKRKKKNLQKKIDDNAFLHNKEQPQRATTRNWRDESDSFVVVMFRLNFFIKKYNNKYELRSNLKCL